MPSENDRDAIMYPHKSTMLAHLYDLRNHGTKTIAPSRTRFAVPAKGVLSEL